MTRHQKALTNKERYILQQIGLSPDAISVYAYALVNSDISAQEVAAELGTFATAVYRLFYKLETMGLLLAKGGRPLRYAAQSKNVALPAAVRMHQQHLLRLLHTRRRMLAQTGPELIMGRDALYKYYEQLARHTKQTIQAYTIGIAYSDSLHATQADALKRGVHIQHVVQQVRPANFHVVHKWQKLGIRIRLNPTARGFHLMIFDEASALVSFSDPGNTDSRISLYTDNAAATDFFRSQFVSVWQASRPVPLW